MSKEKIELLGKIQQVAIKVMNLEKDMEVGKGSYAYKAVSDTQVTLAVKKAEQEAGIISIPTNIELISSEVVKKAVGDNKESLTYVENIKMTVQIFDISTGQSIAVTSLGKGIDSGDKGFGKASTYARKYALLNIYKIATGEDPDADPSKKTHVPATISEKRIKVLAVLNTDVQRANKACQHFGAESTNDLSDKDIEEMYRTYAEKKIITS